MNLIAQPPLHLEGKAQSQSKGKGYTSLWSEQTTNQFSHKNKIL